MSVNRRGFLGKMAVLVGGVALVRPLAAMVDVGPRTWNVRTEDEFFLAVENAGPGDTVMVHGPLVIRDRAFNSRPTDPATIRTDAQLSFVDNTFTSFDGHKPILNFDKSAWDHLSMIRNRFIHPKLPGSSYPSITIDRRAN